MRRNYDVAVVGGGITGASTAYHLKKKGVSVVLLERDKPASGGTGKSAAIIRQHYSTPLLVRLAMASIKMFADMPEELGHSGGYNRVGWIFLLPADAVEGATRNVAMQQSLGVDTRFLSDEEIAERLPWLNPEGVTKVVYEPDGGYADPVQSTEAYLHGLRAAGGEVRLKTPVRGLLCQGNKVTGILTDEGPINTCAVVNAAGPWAHFLAQSAGIDIPLKTVREQDTIWEARPDRPLPQHSISNAVDAIYVRPLGDRRYIVGRGFPKIYYDIDPYNFKITEDEEFVSDVHERLERRFPPMSGVKRLAAYASLYDVSPDWQPFIGPRSGLDGYYDACGGSGHAFKIGPAVGRELAEWIVDGTVKEDFANFSHDRIAAGKMFVQAYGGNRG